MSIHIGPYTFEGVSYDAEADVLYLSVGETAHAVDWDETPEGHAVSFGEDGQLVGLTVVNVRRLLDEGDGKLIVTVPASANAADLSIALA